MKNAGAVTVIGDSDTAPSIAACKAKLRSALLAGANTAAIRAELGKLELAASEDAGRN
jgi:hypothetical protein